MLIPAGCCPSSGLSCWDWTGELAGLITSMAPPPVLSYRLDDTVEQRVTVYVKQRTKHGPISSSPHGQRMVSLYEFELHQLSPNTLTAA